MMDIAEKKTTTFRFDKTIYEKIQMVAKIRRQSATSFIELIMGDFCDDFLEKREQAIYRPKKNS
jgi:hypothetical protein